MFLKIRNRKAHKDKGGIFRKKARSTKKNESAPPPPVEQSLTLAMTLSEDSVEDSCGEQLDDCPQEEPSNVVMFTEQQVMENALRQMREVTELNDSKRQQAAAHKQRLEEKQRQLAENQQQVTNLKQKIVEKQHLFEELKRTHTLKMTAKQEELYKMKNVLHELKQTHEQKLAAKQQELDQVKADSEEKLAEKETELVNVKAELKDTKDELVKVSSVLIGCQHELHEQKNKPFFFWC